VKYKTFFDERHLYFVTCTIAGWKPIFTDPAYAEIVLQSLAWLRRQGYIQLFAFVVMPTICTPSSSPCKALPINWFNDLPLTLTNLLPHRLPAVSTFGREQVRQRPTKYWNGSDKTIR